MYYTVEGVTRLCGVSDVASITSEEDAQTAMSALHTLTDSLEEHYSRLTAQNGISRADVAALDVLVGGFADQFSTPFTTGVSDTNYVAALESIKDLKNIAKQALGIVLSIVISVLSIKVAAFILSLMDNPKKVGEIYQDIKSRFVNIAKINVLASKISKATMDTHSVQFAARYEELTGHKVENARTLVDSVKRISGGKFSMNDLHPDLKHRLAYPCVLDSNPAEISKLIRLIDSLTENLPEIIQQLDHLTMVVHKMSPQVNLGKTVTDIQIMNTRPKVFHLTANYLNTQETNMGFITTAFRRKINAYFSLSADQEIKSVNWDVVMDKLAAPNGVHDQMVKLSQNANNTVQQLYKKFERRDSEYAKAEVLLKDMATKTHPNNTIANETWFASVTQIRDAYLNRLEFVRMYLGCVGSIAASAKNINGAVTQLQHRVDALEKAYKTAFGA